MAMPAPACAWPSADPTRRPPDPSPAGGNRNGWVRMSEAAVITQSKVITAFLFDQLRNMDHLQKLGLSRTNQQYHLALVLACRQTGNKFTVIKSQGKWSLKLWKAVPERIGAEAKRHVCMHACMGVWTDGWMRGCMHAMHTCIRAYVDTHRELTIKHRK